MILKENTEGQKNQTAISQENKKQVDSKSSRGLEGRQIHTKECKVRNLGTKMAAKR
jgi:hypothetical protein